MGARPLGVPEVVRCRPIRQSRRSHRLPPGSAWRERPIGVRVPERLAALLFITLRARREMSEEPGYQAA